MGMGIGVSVPCLRAPDKGMERYLSTPLSGLSLEVPDGSHRG